MRRTRYGACRATLLINQLDSEMPHWEEILRNQRQITRQSTPINHLLDYDEVFGCFPKLQALGQTWLWERDWVKKDCFRDFWLVTPAVRKQRSFRLHYNWVTFNLRRNLRTLPWKSCELLGAPIATIPSFLCCHHYCNRYTSAARSYKRNFNIWWAMSSFERRPL